MIDPGVDIPGRSGTSTARITVRALNDGRVTIDGQFSQPPLRLDGNSWWDIEGINFKSGYPNVGMLRNGSNNNIIRRSIFWDTRIDQNVTTVDHDGADDNLWEDIAVFGVGRFSLANFRGNRNTVRRAWVRWEGSINVGPKRGLLTAYGGVPSSNFTCENCLTTWSAESMPESYTLYHNGAVWTGAGAGTYTNFTVQAGSGPMGTEGNPNEALGTQILGSLAYIRPGDYVSEGASPRVMVNFRWSNMQSLRHTIAVVPPTHPNAGSIIGWYVGDPSITTVGNSAQNISSVVSYLNSFNDWSVSNQSVASAIGAAASPWTTSGAGANLCKRWVAGVQTTQPLWPWPMNDRIKAATASAGAYSGPCPTCVGGRKTRTAVDVTADIEALLGTIPQQCRQ